MQTAVGVFLRDRDHQPQVGFGHFALGLACLHLAGCHLLIDVAQIRKRQHDAGLQVDQFLLQLFDGRDIAGQDRAVGVRAVDFAVDPLEVGFIAGENLDEMAARHAAFVDRNVQNLFLDMTHFIDLAAQRVAQLLDHFGGEADAQQFARNGFLRLNIRLGVVALALERLAHLVELGRDRRELVQRLALQLLELLGREAGGAGCIAFLFLGFLFLFLFFFFVVGRGRRCGNHRFRRIHVDQAVDDFIDLDFIVRDAFCRHQDFRDRGRACRNRLNHVFQAVFDTFGDFDFAFARQQFDRTHFTHVHAHRIGGPAEVGIDRRQGRFRGGFRFVVAGDSRHVIRQQ